MMIYALVCHRQWYHVMRLPVAARPGGAFAWTPEAPESAGPWQPSYGHPIRTKSLVAKLGLPFRNSHHCEIRYRLIIYIIYIYIYLYVWVWLYTYAYIYTIMYIYINDICVIWYDNIWNTCAHHCIHTTDYVSFLTRWASEWSMLSNVFMSF
jgi:hypothetical protein